MTRTNYELRMKMIAGINAQFDIVEENIQTYYTELAVNDLHRPDTFQLDSLNCYKSMLLLQLDQVTNISLAYVATEFAVDLGIEIKKVVTRLTDAIATISALVAKEVVEISHTVVEAVVEGYEVTSNYVSETYEEVSTSVMNWFSPKRA